MSRPQKHVSTVCTESAILNGLKRPVWQKITKTRYVPRVKLNKKRSENVLAFMSTRARSGSRPNFDVDGDIVRANGFSLEIYGK